MDTMVRAGDIEEGMEILTSSSRGTWEIVEDVQPIEGGPIDTVQITTINGGKSILPVDVLITVGS